MASHAFTLGFDRLLDGSDDFLTDTFKFILCNSTYVANKDDEFIDDGGADDVIDGEISATGYTGGFGGADRLTMGSKTITSDLTDDEVVMDCADPTWTALGNGANDTITRTVICKEITNDLASPVYWQNELSSSVTTNGGDITLNIATEGAVNLNT